MLHRVVLLGACIGSLAACASEPPPPPAAPAAPSAAYAGTPKCPPGSAEMPADVQTRMKSLDGDIRTCFTLGTPGKATSSLEVSVTVAASGKVTKARVLGATGNPSGETCVADRLKKTAFGPFCGPEVEIRWTYALQ